MTACPRCGKETGANGLCAACDNAGRSGRDNPWGDVLASMGVSATEPTPAVRKNDEKAPHQDSVPAVGDALPSIDDFDLEIFTGAEEDSHAGGQTPSAAESPARSPLAPFQPTFPSADDGVRILSMEDVPQGRLTKRKLLFAIIVVVLAVNAVISINIIQRLREKKRGFSVAQQQAVRQRDADRSSVPQAPVPPPPPTGSEPAAQQPSPDQPVALNPTSLATREPPVAPLPEPETGPSLRPAQALDELLKLDRISIIPPLLGLMRGQDQVLALDARAGLTTFISNKFQTQDETKRLLPVVPLAWVDKADSGQFLFVGSDIAGAFDVWIVPWTKDHWGRPIFTALETFESAEIAGKLYRPFADAIPTADGFRLTLDILTPSKKQVSRKAWIKRRQFALKLSSLLFDTDGDGLTNQYEVRIMTNPQRRDTDRDGVADSADQNPLVPRKKSKTVGDAIRQLVVTTFCKEISKDHCLGLWLMSDGDAVKQEYRAVSGTVLNVTKAQAKSYLKRFKSPLIQKMSFDSIKLDKARRKADVQFSVDFGRREKAKRGYRVTLEYHGNQWFIQSFRKVWGI